MNRPVSWLVPLVAGALFLLGPQSHAAEPLRYQPTQTHLPAASMKVPVELVDRLPLVEAKINGQGPYLFILDTGASMVALNRPVARTLKLTPSKFASVGDNSGADGRTANVVELASLELGEARFAGIDAVIVDLDFVVGGHRTIDGLLGFGVFADCLLTIDYAAKTVVLARGELPPHDGRDILRYMKVQGFPRITLRLADHSVHLTVDSGSNGCLTLPRSMSKQLSFHAAPVAMGRVQRTQGEPAAELARMAGALKIGRHVVTDPLVRLFGESGVLGNQILEHFVVTFDQKNARIRLARESTEPITIPPVWWRGFYTEERDGAQVVVEVIDRTPADSLGLRVGDRVVQVNDRPYADLGRDGWNALFNGDQPLKLTLQRRKQTLEITIPLVKLVP